MNDPDTRIHTQASIGFGRAAEAYDRGRPDYPQSAVDHLVRVLDINPKSRVVELGAGTGKFTTRLAATKATVIAVEPVANMRNRLTERLPGIEVVDGTAESIPLPDLSVDAVVVAQAFHWFDGPRALAEIHRVLKPGGGLGLIWNVRNESLPWVSRLTTILDQREGEVPQYRTLKWKDAFKGTEFKGGGLKGSAMFSPLETRVFEHVQLLTPTKLLDRVASISFIAALPEVERAAVLDRVRELMQNEPAIRGLAEFEMAYRTFTYWCRKS